MSTDYLTAIDHFLRYDEDTGEIFWKRKPCNRVRAGDPAGSLDRSGCLKIGIAKRLLDAHDIAWFLGHGEWPPSPVTHENGDTLDNRLDNLTLTAPPYCR